MKPWMWKISENIVKSNVDGRNARSKSRTESPSTTAIVSVQRNLSPPTPVAKNRLVRIRVIALVWIISW